MSAKPGIHPRFGSELPDYVVRCRSGSAVRFKFAAPAGTRVSFNGGANRGGRFSATVRLDPGRAIRFAITRGGASRTYHARCLPHDFPRWTAHRTGVPQARFYILTPNDNRTIPRYVAIFDSYGVPVWWMRRDRTPFDASLLPDGNLAWTRLAVHNPSSKYFEERSFDGQVVRTYSTVGIGANEHELQVLPSGNVLMTAYPTRDGVDLRHWGGPAHAQVLDGEIQEVDPQGNLIWDWRTNGHLKTGETKRWFPAVLHGESHIRLHGRTAYDIIHLNSISPVGDGKIVFSARHTDAVYEVDKATGQIDWKLGGRHSSKSLRIVGDGYASKEFGGQHDVRVLKAGRLLTVYENGAHRNRAPRALAFRIDAKARTARLVKEIRFAPAGRDSICCGSARLLPGGDWVVAWGHTPWVTEQTPSGRPVLTIKFAEPLMMSYRAEPILPGRLTRSVLRRGMDAMVAP